MKVTVCELPDDRIEFQSSWNRLISETKNKTDLLLLPELSFSSWFAKTPIFNKNIWEQSCKDHDSMLQNFPEFFQSTVLGTMSVTEGNKHLNQGFSWTAEQGYKGIHDKYFLPEEEYFYEQSWFDRNKKDFSLHSVNNVTIGFQICTEVMFNEWSRYYGRKGANIIVVPRASSSHERWPIALCMAAVASGCFVLSSNRRDNKIFGGTGYIIDPNGKILASTSREQPIVTCEINTEESNVAKNSYPRNVSE